MMKKLFLALGLLFLATFIQTGWASEWREDWIYTTVQGYVLDEVTNEPVVNAEIIVDYQQDDNSKAKTNLDGYFILPKPLPRYQSASFTLQISHPDYQDYINKYNYGILANGVPTFYLTKSIREENAIITGTVIDETTEQPLVGVAVQYKGVTLYTKDQGQFIIEGLKQSEHFQISLSLPGYQTSENDTQLRSAHDYNRYKLNRIAPVDNNSQLAVLLGKVLPGATVEINYHNIPLNPDGTFKVTDLTKGTKYRIVITKKGYQRLEQEIQVKTASLSMEFQLQPNQDAKLYPFRILLVDPSTRQILDRSFEWIIRPKNAVIAPEPGAWKWNQAFHGMSEYTNLTSGDYDIYLRNPDDRYERASVMIEDTGIDFKFPVAADTTLPKETPQRVILLGKVTPGALIEMNGQKVVAGSDGSFKVVNLKQETKYIVVITKEGYQRFEQEITIPKTTSLTLDFQLKPIAVIKPGRYSLEILFVAKNNDQIMDRRMELIVTPETIDNLSKWGGKWDIAPHGEISYPNLVAATYNIYVKDNGSFKKFRVAITDQGKRIRLPMDNSSPEITNPGSNPGSGSLYFFSSKFGANGSIARLNMKTMAIEPLGIENRDYTVSPDNQYLVYIGKRFKFHIYNLESKSDVEFENSRAFEPSAAFISSTQFAYLKDGIIYVTSINKTEPKKLPYRIPDRILSGTMAWVPGGNGSNPAFVLSARTGLYLVTAEITKVILPVATEGELFRYPAVSPDGKKVLFTREREKGVWVVNIDGSNLTQLNRNEECSQPGWSPDGKSIVFACTGGGERGSADRITGSNIWVMGADGTNPHPLFASDGKSVGIRAEIIWK